MGGQNQAPGTSPITAVGTPQPATATSHVAQPQPLRASTPATLVASRKMSGAGTPKPSVGTPRPGSRAANTAHGAGGGVTTLPGAPVNTGVGAGAGVSRSMVPRPGSTVPRPGSTVPRPGSAVPAMKPVGTGLPQQQPPLHVSTPAEMRPGTPMDVDAGQRGKKRERDDALPNGVNPTPNPYGANGGTIGNGYANGASNGVPRPGAINAKAGTGNIRPRPIKKQRMVGSALRRPCLERVGSYGLFFCFF